MSTAILNQDRTHQTRSVLTGLESLRKEHQVLLSSTKIDEEKQPQLQQTLESIDLGISEAIVLLQLEHHLDELDSETYKLILQVQRLTEENNWLRGELTTTEENLQSSTKTTQDYEKDIRLLKESLAETTQPTETLILTDAQDIEKEMTNESKEPNSENPNVESKNHSEVPVRFRTLHNLVIQYAQAGRYEVAVPLCRQALEDLEKTHGHMHPDVATMLNILALVYRDQNKFKEALQLLTEALTIREKTLGLEHPAVAATLNNIAVLYGKKNRYKEAEPLCKRALDIRIKCFGSDHPDVGKQLNNLALLCLNQGKYEQVEEYYRRAIEIYSKHYGKNDPNVAKTKNNLASAYLREGKYKLAAQLYQEVLSSEQGEHVESSVNTTPVSLRDGSTVMTTLKNLGALCRRQGFYEQAELIESCASKSIDNPQAVSQALAIIRQIRIHDETNPANTRRTQQQAPPPDYSRMRRSGSFQRLRQTIRRGSEKIVQRLRGSSSNNGNIQQVDHAQTTTTEQIKRSSSMSTLNNTSSSTSTVQQQNASFRGRLTSAENLNG